MHMHMCVHNVFKKNLFDNQISTLKELGRIDKKYCITSVVQIFEISNRIVTSVFNLIRNKYNYSKFSNTYHH